MRDTLYRLSASRRLAKLDRWNIIGLASKLAKTNSKIEKNLHLARQTRLAHEQKLRKLNCLGLSEADSLSPGLFKLQRHGGLARLTCLATNKRPKAS